MNPFLRPCLRPFSTTVFSEMRQLAAEHGAIDLGQGAPEFDGPEFVKEAAVQAIRGGFNQYCPSSGVPALTQAIAVHQERFYGLTYDPEREVTVFAGATEALFSTFLALCQEGDEFLLIEPFYDAYRAVVVLAGGVPRAVPLGPPSFDLDAAALAALISPRTRAIVLNDPHNPTGKVFLPDELTQLAALCRKYDLLAITDQVYEHLVYQGTFTCLATLPGMRERTIVISSTGKTFNCTGWKIGYACASATITAALRTVHQFVTFCNGTPLQYAMAEALKADDSFFAELLTGYRARRDALIRGLAEAGFHVFPPQGTYFALADVRPLGYDDAGEFCRQLPAAAGVAALPISSLYLHPEEGRSLVRFAFCKTIPTLEEAVRRLQRTFGSRRHKS